MSTNYADPFDVWKTLYQEIEPQISKSLHNVLGSEMYAALSSQLLTTMLQMEQYFKKNIEHLLQTYKVPSLKDFERLSELVVGIESKIDAIDERLIRLEQEAAQTSELRGTMTELSQQLAVLNESLQALTKASVADAEAKQKRGQKN
jgi:polyhydroxyalkanoic acid synthase PhaR subunit